MVLRKEIIAPLIRATAIHAWHAFENPDHVLASQSRFDLIQKIFDTCKIVDSLETFYVPLFTDFPPDTPSPFSNSSASPSTGSKPSRGNRSPRKKLVKDKEKVSQKYIRSIDDEEVEEGKRERVCIFSCFFL